MLKFETTTKFDRDMKRITKRGLNLSLLNAVIQTLIEEKPLDPKHNDHALKGDYAGFRECHILPNWLLIYKINKGRLILTASRTGSHSDLF
jgi:mRNA interferase YafQ